MSVMSQVTSNGRKIPIPHFILKREWKLKDHVHYLSFCAHSQPGFLCLINVAFIQLRNCSFIENNDYSNPKQSSVNSLSFAMLDLMKTCNVEELYYWFSSNNHLGHLNKVTFLKAD